MQRTILLMALCALALAGGVTTAKAIKGGHIPVVICHKPGTPAEHTITVDESAVAAHLAHGDYLGPCQDQPPPSTTTDEGEPNPCSPEGKYYPCPEDTTTGCSERGDSLNGPPICHGNKPPLHVPGETKLAPHKLFVAGQRHHCGEGFVFVKGHCAVPGLW